MTSYRRLLGAAALAVILGANSASATAIDITITGTLSDGGAGFPWGMDYWGGTWHDIDGDSFVANFHFDTALGTGCPYAGGNCLSEVNGATGSITVGGHTFAVLPYSGPTFTAAFYARDPNFIEVLFYDDPTASLGAVFEASALTPWGGGLTDQINNAPATTPEAVAILADPGGAYYNFAAFATIDTVSVAAPEPATLGMLGFGLGVACLAQRFVPRRKVFATAS